ncbi:MAG: SsrA-binding protein SmpB [Patescibacteria group bacterium]
MKMPSNGPKRITNRRAKFDYELGDSIVVGIELTGAETKALRLGHGHIKGAYVTIKGNELWLLNSTIHGTNAIKLSEQQQTRTRRLLAKRKEINELITAKQQGKSIIPIELLTAGRYIKLRISTGRGRKRYDKRQVIKARDEDRNTARLLAK